MHRAHAENGHGAHLVGEQRCERYGCRPANRHCAREMPYPRLRWMRDSDTLPSEGECGCDHVAMMNKGYPAHRAQRRQPNRRDTCGTALPSKGECRCNHVIMMNKCHPCPLFRPMYSCSQARSRPAGGTGPACCADDEDEDDGAGTRWRAGVRAPTTSPS